VPSYAPTSSLGFSSLSVLAVLVHDGLLMSCRALSVALSHTFYKRTQLSAHQVQPLCFVVVEQGLEAFIHSLSAFMIVFMCGLRIFTLGFLEMMFLSQAASHVSKTATALRMLWSAVSLELSLNQVLQPVPHAPDDWCAVCFEPLGGASLGDGSAADAASATAASLGGCVRLPCNHCFHKVNHARSLHPRRLFSLLTFFAPPPFSQPAALHGGLAAQEGRVSYLQGQCVAFTD